MANKMQINMLWRGITNTELYKLIKWLTECATQTQLQSICQFSYRNSMFLEQRILIILVYTQISKYSKLRKQ